MPGNIVEINSDANRWYVGDSKMDALIKVLKKIGIKTDKKSE